MAATQDCTRYWKQHKIVQDNGNNTEIAQDNSNNTQIAKIMETKHRLYKIMATTQDCTDNRKVVLDNGNITEYVQDNANIAGAMTQGRIRYSSNIEVCIWEWQTKILNKITAMSQKAYRRSR